MFESKTCHIDQQGRLVTPPPSPAGFPPPPASRRRRWLFLAIGASALTVAVYLGICALILHLVVTPQRKLDPAGPPADLRVEPVHFESAEDKIRLAGWLLPSSGDRAIVLVHGLNSDGWCGAHTDIARAYVEAGFHVLVFDLRGRGLSGGDRIGFGWLERRDVRGAVDLLLSRGFQAGRIGIHGTSYGGATALLSAATIPELGAVVADSAFADM